MRVGYYCWAGPGTIDMIRLGLGPLIDRLYNPILCTAMESARMRFLLRSAYRWVIR